MYEVGTGTPKLVAIADPGVGADLVVTVPKGKAWRVLFMKSRMRCSAVVATRYYKVEIWDQNNNYLATYSSGLNLTASGAQTLHAVQYLAPVGNSGGSGAMTSLPDVVLKSGASIRYTSFGKDAGDQWDQATAYVEEFND